MMETTTSSSTMVKPVFRVLVIGADSSTSCLRVSGARRAMARVR
jgi:hypothetical protein